MRSEDAGNRCLRIRRIKEVEIHMANSEARNQAELGTAPIGGLMRRYAIPCVISLVVSALYNIVDQLFIANASYLGSYGNAANTTVFPLVIICLSLSSMFGDGTNAYYTFCVGGGRSKEAKNTVGTTVTTVLALGILFLIFYNVFSTPLLNAFGANVNEETFRNAREYLFWISLGLPFYMLGQALSPIICGDGSPRYAMITMLTGCAINIVFDPILIYVAKWGMKGAAIATITGQIVVCILNLMYLRRMNSVTMTSDCFIPHLQALKQIIPLGMTSFFSQLSIVLSMAAVNNVLNIYGAQDPIFSQEEYSQIPLAVVGLVFKFFQIIVSVAIGLTAGCVPIIGYNRGSGQNDRLLELLGKIIKAEACVGIAAFIIFEGFATPITYLFGAANESVYYQDFAVTCIRLFLSMVIISCINKGIMIFLQGMGKAAQSTTISVIREIIGGVGLPILLPMLFGFDGILFFMPLAEILTFVFALVFILQMRKELKAGTAAQASAGAVPAAAGSAAAGSAAAVPVSGAAPLTNLVITVGRSYGSGGRSVGKLLAEKLNIPYYDSVLLEQAAEESGLSHEFLKSLDEKPVDTHMLYQYRGYSASQYGMLEDLAGEAQREIIEKVASEGPCVIVGRRADQILEGKAETLNIFVTASLESRTARIEQRDGLTELESIKKIAKVDRERAAYYNQHSEKEWGAAASYDLCVDTDKFGVEGAASLIAAMLPGQNPAA